MQLSFDVLILGAGWTSTFLIPLCKERSLTCSATTQDGRDGTLKWGFDPDSEDEELYTTLPDAKTVVITFPIKTPGASERLVRMYSKTRKNGELQTGFIQLGSTGVWDDPPKLVANKWYDRHTPVGSGERAVAETELLGLYPAFRTTVLNLAGLWGGPRSTRNWVGRVAPTKEALKHKGSIHMIHGVDLARCILAVHANFEKAAGQRWLLTDGRIYDWWDLASAWGLPSHDLQNGSEGIITEEDKERGPHPRWVRELMDETGVRALPRSIETLGRAMDSRDFWKTFELSPLKARLEG